MTAAVRIEDTTMAELQGQGEVLTTRGRLLSRSVCHNQDKDFSLKFYAAKNSGSETKKKNSVISILDVHLYQL